MQVIMMKLSEIGRPARDHALFDARALLPIDPEMRADVAARGIQNPIHIVSRENLAEFGIHTTDPVWINDGNQRFNIASDLKLAEVPVVFRRIDSLSDWWMHNISDNTMTVPETLESLIQKAKLAVKLDVPIEQIAKWVRKDVSTVKGWLPNMIKLGDDTGEIVAPVLREAIKKGEIDYGGAVRAATGTIEEQTATMAEVAVVQMAALAKDASGEKVTPKIDGARIEVKENGEKVAVPTQTTVDTARNKVKGKKAPAKESQVPKREQAKIDPATVPVAVIKARLGQVPLMQRLPGVDPAFVKGIECALRSILGESVDLGGQTFGLSAEMLALVFPAPVAPEKKAA